ncbi:hypothetical protein AAG747_29165 [Rapidithrix thailandica]|uniref:Uncharacterized protein n=1 Tax=Rapidithrix thailandica TaxID=413964 RepID=A0AAW9SFZ3_9BACT
MKYWRINSLCKFTSHEWLKSKVLDEIKMYLWKREYLCPDFDRHQSIKSPDKRTYRIRKVWNAEGNIFSVFVENESNWESSHGVSEPQIITLIQDFFKVNNGQWYYLETLTENEDSKISKSVRQIEPIQIKDFLDTFSSELVPPKPQIIEIGKYEYQETDMYYGLKTQFKTILDFWISCLYWVNCGELEGEGLTYLSYFNSYDLASGSCIPMNLNEIDEIIKEIKSKTNTLNNPVSVYLMRKDWNDKVYVLEYEDRFVMHNWHTAE